MAASTNNDMKWSPSSSFCSPLAKTNQLFSMDESVEIPSNLSHENSEISNNNNASYNKYENQNDNEEVKIDHETIETNKAVRVTKAMPATPTTASLLPSAESKVISPTSITEAFETIVLLRTLIDENDDETNDDDRKEVKEIFIENNKHKKNNLNVPVTNDEALELKIESLHSSLGDTRVLLFYKLFFCFSFNPF